MYLATLSGWLTPAPAIVGSARGAAKDPSRLALWWWMVALGLEDLGVSALSLSNRPSWNLTWFAYPITLWLGLTALLGFHEMADRRRWRVPLFWAFVVFWLVGPVIGDRQAGFSVYVASVHAFLLAGVACWLLVEACTRPRPGRNPACLAAVATIISYGPFLAVWPISVALEQSHPSLVLPLWEVRAAFLIVGSLLYTLSLW